MNSQGAWRSLPAVLRAYAELGLTRNAAEVAMNDLSAAQRRRLRIPLSRLLAAAGRYDLARTLLISGGDALSEEEHWRASYPLAYPRWVRTLTAAEGLEFFLPMAIMRVESHYNPDAVSPTGAVGLMQLMPDTARRIALDRKWQPAPAAALRDPFTNLRYGIAELGRLARRFKANLALTIAGYNADADRVAEWWARRGALGEEEFVASIPYTETRHYVQRVLASLETYRSLYGLAGHARAEVN